MFDHTLIQETHQPGDEIAKRDFLHILASLGYAPGTIAVNLFGSKEDSMLVKRIAACTHLSSTVYEL